MTTWFNADGVNVRGGRDRGRRQDAKSLKTFGDQHVIEIPFDLTKIADGTTTFTADRDNDGTLDGFDTGDTYIPDQAFIESAAIYMTDEAAAGGTSIAVGLYTVTGSAIDADGLVTTTNGATANLTANAKQAGSGADVATAVTQDAYIAITGAGTFTAGKGVIRIVYTLHRTV